MTPFRQPRLSRRQFLMASGLAGAGLIAPGLSPAHASDPFLYSPILMYHHIGYLPPNPDAIRADLTVAPDLFSVHLDALAAAGYTVISMTQLWSGLAGGATLPPKPVVLTFDDGYDDAYQHAFRILAAHHMIGMFYLITGLAGQPGYLSWQQAVEMRAAGMEVGNHTVHHRDLWWLSYSDRVAEIDGAAAAIANVFGDRPRFFCYPFGHFNTYVAQIVRQTGHVAATTIGDGTVHTALYPYWMHRVRIHNFTTPNDIDRLLNRWV